MKATSVLQPEPDWYAGAQTLINGCAALHTPQDCVSFMDRICWLLGDQLYPAFLKLLCMVSTYGDTHAQQTVANTLAHALLTGPMPSGRLNAWGSGCAAAQTRCLGPIEYLCAWYVQQSAAQPLGAVAFESSACAVIALVSSHAQAKQCYCAKLKQDIDDPLGGSLSRRTRSGLLALVTTWEAGGSPQAVVQSWFNALRQDPWADLTPSNHLAGSNNFQGVVSRLK